MTTVQRVAQIFGVVFLLIALLGFLMTPGGLTMEEGLLLGLFPVNVLHNLFHAAFGVWGLVASRSFSSAKTYAQVGGVIYLLLVVLAFPFPWLLGVIPIYGHDIWLHALLGIVLAAVGFTARERPAATV